MYYLQGRRLAEVSDSRSEGKITRLNEVWPVVRPYQGGGN